VRWQDGAANSRQMAAFDVAATAREAEPDLIASGHVRVVMFQDSAYGGLYRQRADSISGFLALRLRASLRRVRRGDKLGKRLRTGSLRPPGQGL